VGEEINYFELISHYIILFSIRLALKRRILYFSDRHNPLEPYYNGNDQEEGNYPNHAPQSH
jgi:hypothetical protein